ncbi:MAG: T9SS type A sorting domain-containing protein [candidate division WOR-3 bacterium]|nr:T9SS type A sorting domain-containing protein [candidate division WOR-3 bacterium]
MKKLLLAALVLLAASSLSAAPVLVEAYNEKPITIPEDKMDTVTVVELSFSVDTSCYVLFTAGGLVWAAKAFLQLDGTDLFPASIGRGVTTRSVHIAYTYPLSPGDHIVHLRMTKLETTLRATCYEAYLQALIFLPDTATAVAEQPTSDAEPSVNTPSLIASGPYVNVAGASELVDATGRVIENAISDDKVYLSNLPTGTYFARDGERTIVKIVKVE